MVNKERLFKIFYFPRRKKYTQKSVIIIITFMLLVLELELLVLLATLRILLFADLSLSFTALLSRVLGHHVGQILLGKHGLKKKEI